MYICVCHAVTDRQIRETVNCGAYSFSDVQARLAVGSCCGSCNDSAQKLVEDLVRSRTEVTAA